MDEALTLAFDEADIVIVNFSPYAPYILKGPEDLKVVEAEWRWSNPSKKKAARWVFLTGSRDKDEVKANAEKARKS